MNIWNHKIQELILSGEYDNILLATELIKDKQALASWFYLSQSTTKDFGLPYIGSSSAIHNWLIKNTEFVFDQLSDDIKYIRKSYEQYLEQKDSGTHIK